MPDPIQIRTNSILFKNSFSKDGKERCLEFKEEKNGNLVIVMDDHEPFHLLTRDITALIKMLKNID